MKLVVNIKDKVPYDVYCGRGPDPRTGTLLPWGNPFSCKPSKYAIWIVASREEAISCHRQYALSQPDLVRRARAELHGKVLACHCDPLPCHCWNWVEIANGDWPIDPPAITVKLSKPELGHGWYIAQKRDMQVVLSHRNDQEFLNKLFNAGALESFALACHGEMALCKALGRSWLDGAGLDHHLLRVFNTPLEQGRLLIREIAKDAPNRVVVLVRSQRKPIYEIVGWSWAGDAQSSIQSEIAEHKVAGRHVDDRALKPIADLPPHVFRSWI